MSLRTKFRAGVLLALGLAMAWPIAAHYRAKWKVELYRRELKAKGEKVAISELIPPRLIDSPNGARALLTVGGRLSSLDLSNLPPTMKLLAPGHALVAWNQAFLPTADSTNIWPGLSGTLDQNGNIIADARAALEDPVIAFDLNYSQGFNLAVSHLMCVKRVSQWLSAAAILDLHEGRSSNAWENLQALIALVEKNKTEPLMISELVRIALGQIALNATWEALQCSDWRDEQLGELQKMWASVDLLTQAESVLAMERAMGEKVFAEGRQSYAVITSGSFSAGAKGSGLAELTQMGKDVLDDPKEGLRALARRYPGYWAWRCWQSYEDELANMQIVQAGIEAGRVARKDRALGLALKQLGQTAAAIQNAHPNVGKWLGYSLASDGMVDRFLSRVSTLEIERSLLIAAIALKRCQLKHGAYPENLAALVPEFLPETPRDAMDGQPLRYRLKPDGSFLLYSVGEDGEDNGGDAAPTKPGSVLATKQWWKARDAVWPMPATVEEVRAEFAKLEAQRKTNEEVKLDLERLKARQTSEEMLSPSPAASPGTNSPDAEAFRKRYGLPPPAAAQTNATINTAK